jgi:hypothetical protein
VKELGDLLGGSGGDAKDRLTISIWFCFSGSTQFYSIRLIKLLDLLV